MVEEQVDDDVQEAEEVEQGDLEEVEEQVDVGDRQLIEVEVVVVKEVVGVPEG